MNIDAVKNGIVLDHIPAGRGMELYRYLFPNSEKHILARGYCADLPSIERNDQ